MKASENRPFHAADPGLVRAWAAERLVEYDDAETMQALCLALTDEYELVRKRAAESLLKLKPKDAATALFDRVADDLWMAERFCELRGEFAGMSYADPEWGGKSDALSALRAIAPDRVTKALEKAEQSTNESVRAWAKRQREK